MLYFSAAAVPPSGMYSKCACHSHPPDSPCLTTQLESSRPNSVQSLKELSLTSLHEGNKSSLVNKIKYIFFIVKRFLSLSHLSLVQAWKCLLFNLVLSPHKENRNIYPYR